jgi:uncharacterized protein (DUF1330 family)
MAAYIMIDRLAVTDPEAFRTYAALASATVAGYGGRYLLPDRIQIEALEGNWTPNRVVLIEFDDADQAKQWWSSPQYAAPRALHRAATISNIILLDTVADSLDNAPRHDPLPSSAP